MDHTDKNAGRGNSIKQSNCKLSRNPRVNFHGEKRQGTGKRGEEEDSEEGMPQSKKAKEKPKIAG